MSNLSCLDGRENPCKMLCNHRGKDKSIPLVGHTPSTQIIMHTNQHANCGLVWIALSRIVGFMMFYALIQMLAAMVLNYIPWLPLSKVSVWHIPSSTVACISLVLISPVLLPFNPFVCSLEVSIPSYNRQRRV